MHRIIGISEDKYWLEAIKKAVDDKVIVRIVHCSDPLVNCLDELSEAGKDTLFLIDAYSKISISEVVSTLSRRGWRYLVVVTADPSVKEAYTIFHESGGYDYWEKTYMIPDIQTNIKKCLTEIHQCPLEMDSMDFE
jgi:hypothetical protein